MESFSNRSNGAERPRTRKEFIDQLKAGLAASPLEAVHYLLKTGYVARNEYRCGDIKGTAPKKGGGTFHYTFANRKWKDYGKPGERGGVGEFDLYCAHCDEDVNKAIELAAAFLSLPVPERQKPRQDRASSGKAKDKAPWFEVIPGADVPPPRFRSLFAGTFKQAWAYRDEAGALLFYVALYQRSARKKDVVAITFGHNGDGKLEWKARGGSAILFGLELLAERPDAEVWIFEGEKTAAAARLLFPDVICLAWKGGTGNAGNIDLAPLAGRRVRHVSDRDDNGAGQKAMRIIAERALKAGAVAVAVADFPDNFADGWDVADFNHADPAKRQPGGWHLQRIRDHIEAAPWQGPPTPPPPRGTKEGIEPRWPSTALPVSEVRAKLAEVIADRGTVAARGTPGLGKTTAEESRAKGEEGWLLFLEPTHAIARQVAADMKGFGHHLAGRAHEYAPGKTMCAIPDDAEAAHAAGLNVRQELCKFCPYKLGCRYLDQLDRIDYAMQTQKAGAIVTVHPYYTQTLPGEVDTDMIDRIVIDERLDLDRETSVPLDRLTGEAFSVLFGERIAKAFDAEGYLDLSDFTVEELEEQAGKEELHTKLTLHEEWTFEERRAAIQRFAEQRRKEFRWRFARLYRAMSREIAAGRTKSNQVTLHRKETDRKGGDHRDIIHVHERRNPSEKLAGKPIHYIDGTMDEIHAAALLGDNVRLVRLDAVRNLHVTQVCDSLFSKNRLLYRKGAEAARQELYRFILALGARFRTILIGAPLTIREIMEPEWQEFAKAAKGAPVPVVSWLHMNAGRGVNAFEKYEACVVIGREEPRARPIEALARMRRPDTAITPLPGDAAISPDWPERYQGYTMKDGRMLGVPVTFHPDPTCQSVLEQIREGEIVQIADRLRGVNRQDTPALFLLSSIPTEIPVDRLLPWRELRDEICGGKWWQEAARIGGGIAPLKAEWLVAKGIFETEGAAKRAVSRFLETEREGSIVATFRTIGQRGRDSSAIMEPGTPDAAELLAGHVGPLAEFDGAKVPEVHEAAAYEPDEPEIVALRIVQPVELDTAEGMRKLVNVLKLMNVRESAPDRLGGLSAWSQSREIEEPEESAQEIGNFPGSIVHMQRLC